MAGDATNRTNAADKTRVHTAQTGSFSKLFEKSTAKTSNSSEAKITTRPDLGELGNWIRDQVDSAIEKDLFEHYWQGRKWSIRLTDETFKRVVQELPRAVQTTTDVVLIDGETLIRKQYAFPKGEFDQAFGTASVFFDKTGNAVGFYDEYNFDIRLPDAPSRFGIVSGVRGACAVSGNCSPFNVIYGQFEKPVQGTK